MRGIHLPQHPSAATIINRPITRNWSLNLKENYFLVLDFIACISARNKMSHLTYYNYPGVGERNAQNFKYSQAVRIGDRIECSGQGTYSPSPFLPFLPASLTTRRRLGSQHRRISPRNQRPNRTSLRKRRPSPAHRRRKRLGPGVPCKLVPCAY